MFKRRFFFILAPVLLSVLPAPLHAAGNPIAILDSNHSREFFARHYGECNGGNWLGNGQEFERYLWGWTHVMDQYSLPYAVIHDDQVTDSGLAPFRLLVLANTVSLSDDQTRAIQKWVNSGGRLIATFGSGYKDIVLDSRQDDQLKLQNGGTFGLHNLWRDPMSKVFSSNSLGIGVPFVKLTQLGTAPTANLSGIQSGNLLPYGFLANMLVQRPEARDDVYGVFVFDPASGWTRPAPAILINKAAKGLVVYFAFSPEYPIALANKQPRDCPNATGVFTDSANAASSLIRSTIQYMLQQ